jgi:predicted nucleotidyltransferase
VDVVAIALVGSWARRDETPESDVDLVVLTDEPTAYTERDDWVDALAPGAVLVRTGDWHAIVERRIQLPSGLEVEVERHLGLAARYRRPPLTSATWSASG